MALIEKSFESLNATNWYNKVTKGGNTVGQPTTETDPNVQLRIVDGTDGVVGSVTYPDFLINPELNSFEFNTDIYWTGTLGGGGDYYELIFGSTKQLRIFFNFYTGNITNGFSGIGVYIVKNGLAVLKSTTAPGPTGTGENTWFPVRVLYDRNAANTWTVMINGTTVLTYTDPDVNIWQRVADNKGVTIYSYSGGSLRMRLFVRRLGLTYKAMMPVLTLPTGVMPKKFYPSADDSTFSSNRAAYMRTLYPRITNTATAADITKQKLIFNRHDASSRMERLKLQAIGKSSMRVKENDTIQTKAPNVNDVRDALSRSRSQGYVVPPKFR